MEIYSSIRPAATNWWVYLLAGLGLLGLGLWVFNSPGAAFLGLTFYFAGLIYLMAWPIPSSRSATGRDCAAGASCWP
jgi:uncharacterized membrane protein HdeD (DUF308 family)